MSVVRFLIAWPNAPFTIVGGIAIVFAIVQATGLLGLFSGGDHDADHDGEPDAEHDADHDADHASMADAIFGALGVGKVPLSLIWQTYAVVFAVTGLALNARWLGTEGPPLSSLLWTVPIGTVVGYAVVATLARLLAPVFATKPHEATSRAELVGQSGVVISSQVTEDFGEIRIRDKSGHDLRVVCRLAPGSKPPTERQRIVVVDYEPERGHLLVAPLEEEDPSRAAKAP